MTFRAPILPLPTNDTKAYLAELHRTLQSWMDDLARYTTVPAWRDVAAAEQAIGSGLTSICSKMMAKQSRAFTVVIFTAHATTPVRGQLLRDSTEIFAENALGEGSVTMMSLEEPNVDAGNYIAKLSGPATISRASLLVMELRG